MIIDIGTGDGRSVLSHAAADPAALVFGVDAAAAPMAEASRRADRRGPRNSLFLAAGVESLALTPLAQAADLVTVSFPWGSLLRGLVGLEADALRGIAAALRQGGRLDALASVAPRDGVAGIDCLDGAWEPLIRARWSDVGLELVSLCPASAGEIAASRSTWAPRLGARRAVWRLDGRLKGRRSASIGR